VASSRSSVFWLPRRDHFKLLANLAVLLPASSLLASSVGLVPFRSAFAASVAVALILGVPLLVVAGRVEPRVPRSLLAGLLATLAYDGLRAILLVAGLAAQPFKTIPIYGQFAMGRGGALPEAIGWAFHFWNGAAFGLVLGLATPRPSLVLGVAWGLVLELALVATSWRLLQITLTEEFLAVSAIGHLAYGVTLAAALSGGRPNLWRSAR
jgi:hypothetical protein